MARFLPLISLGYKSGDFAIGTRRVRTAYTTVHGLTLVSTLTGSSLTVASGSHVVTNWHVVACTKEGGKVGVLLNANTQEVVAAEVRWRYEMRAAPAFRLSRHAFSAFGLNL